MRTLIVSWMLVFAGAAGWTQATQGPSNPKAQKSYAEGFKALQEHQQPVFALNDFQKADKQDGGKCNPCQQQIVSVALSIDDFKSAERATQAMIAEATDHGSVALAHNERGVPLLREAASKKKDDLYMEADGEFQKAIASAPNFSCSRLLRWRHPSSSEAG